MKQSTTRPVNVPINKPAWVKEPNDGTSTPPWMKSSNASDKSDSKPGWVKKDEPGMQNRWKKQQSEEIEKQKK